MSVLRDGLSLAVTFGLTGWLLGLAVLPERLGAARRSAISLALAVPATVLVSSPGLAAGRLGIAPLGAGLVVLAAVAAFRLGVRPATVSLGRLSGRARSAMRYARSRLDRRTIVAAVLVFLVAASAWLSVVESHWEVPRSSGLPRGTTVWFYWDLVTETVAEGSLPDTRLEWGRTRPFPVEYGVTTLHGAATAKLAGGTDLELLERYRFFMVLLGLVAAYALWRRWLPAWWAWIAGLLTIAAPQIANRFVSYRPETFGLLLVLWSAWLLDEGLERRSARWTGLAAVVSACAFMAHAEVWLVGVPLWAAIVISRVLPLERVARSVRASARGSDPEPASETPAAPPRLRTLVGPLGVATAAFVACVVALSLVGDGGERVSKLAGFGESAKDAAPDAVPFPDIDPTWTLHAALYAPANIGRPPPEICSFFVDRKARYPYRGVNMQSRGTQIGLALLLLLTVPALSGRFGAAGARGALVTCLLGLGVVLLAGLICEVYGNYVPGRAGPQRILPFYVLAIAGLLGTVGWLLSSWASAAGERLRPGSGRASYLAASGLLSVAMLLALTPVTGGRSADLQNLAPVGPSLSDTAYQAYEWMDERLPKDAVILANGYTEGSLRAVSRRVGWLDGRAPYLESQAWRTEATRATLDARRFFLDPIGEIDSLPPEVTHVLIATKGSVEIGGSRFAFARSDLFETARLRFLRAFDQKKLLLFEVTPEPAIIPSADLPSG